MTAAGDTRQPVPAAASKYRSPDSVHSHDPPWQNRSRCDSLIITGPTQPESVAQQRSGSRAHTRPPQLHLHSHDQSMSMRFQLDEYSGSSRRRSNVIRTFTQVHSPERRTMCTSAHPAAPPKRIISAIVDT
jgi:hypothetical protein